MLPTFLIIGAQKCGTTALSTYVAAHRDVYVTTPKEPDFFDGAWDRGLEWYESLFAGAGTAAARGEASTSYTKAPHVGPVPERVAQVVPDVRLVYIVRNPIDRIRSHHRHEVWLRREHRPLARALLQDPRYVDFSRYGFQLDRYLDHFPREQLLVVSSDRLATDRDRCVREVLAFVGVDPDTPLGPVLDDEVNVGEGRRRLPAPAYWVRRGLDRTGLHRRIPARLRLAIRRSTEVDIPPEWSDLDDVATRRIWDTLAPDLARLRDIVGPDFDLWGAA